MHNRKIVIASIVLGILILGFVAGSLWLFIKSPRTKKVSTETKTVQEENLPAVSEPEIVTVDTLSPEELARLWLQMWYGRDFAGMYSILDEQLQQKESLTAFVQRLQTLPALTAIRINATERTNSNASTATLTLAVDGKTSKGVIQRDLVFSFQKTNGQWKIASPLTFPE